MRSNKTIDVKQAGKSIGTVDAVQYTGEDGLEQAVTDLGDAKVLDLINQSIRTNTRNKFAAKARPTPLTVAELADRMMWALANDRDGFLAAKAAGRTNAYLAQITVE